MKDWRFLPIETRNGYWNMALDEALLEAVIQKRSPFTIRIYKWAPSTVSIGRNQSLNEEIDVRFCRQQQFNILRRITGGGAVFHDNQGEITYSIICSIKFLEEKNALNVIEQYEIITNCIIACLDELGLKTNKGIIHCPAIFLNNKKFSGNAQIRRRGYILQHGTILLELNPELMYSALRSHPKVSHSRMVQSVRAKCIGIKNNINNYDEIKFIGSLKQGFIDELGINLINGYFSNWELKFAEKLINEKYDNKKWLEKYE
ncbi:MAG: lipoate--protein ligase family protein [Candidatus Lokiarchaeota archaeon]|nr:lipoate--protein ligase family protein [Candidatus Lokiarchaeota archaeon]